MQDEELHIDDDIKAAIGSAFQSGNFVTVGYVGDDGWPRLSRRGTVQVLDSQQVGLWARKPDTGLAPTISERPELTLLYVDLSKPQLYSLYGRGASPTMRSSGAGCMTVRRSAYRHRTLSEKAPQ